MAKRKESMKNLIKTGKINYYQLLFKRLEYERNYFNFMF